MASCSSVKIPDTLLDKLRKAAEQRRQTIRTVLTIAVEEWLAREGRRNDTECEQE